MKDPFLVRYGLLFNEEATVNLAIAQVLAVTQRSFNIRTNLPFHAWSYDKDKPWSDPITGQSRHHWSRASGWFSMALVDILEYLPPSHDKYDAILTIYRRLIEGLKAAQHPRNGLWYQVLDANDKHDNYPEISGSSMMVYAIQKGVNLGLLSKEYESMSMRGWQGGQSHIKTYTDGGPQITSVAPGMGSQVNYKAYVGIAPVSVPRAEEKQFSHGYAAVLMAASVMDTAWRKRNGNE